MPLRLTKLNRPRPAKDILPRQRLMEMIAQGRDRPLILVSAPAGYGKTILISRWVEAIDRPSAWISLDENDNDLQLFIAYFLEAVENLFPGACRNTRIINNSPQFPPMKVVLTCLSNELDAIASDFIVVIDDYYRIKNPTIHEFLDSLLRHPPEQMQLALVSRYDPPLALSTYRAGSRMTEIRARDLRFTVPETAAFMLQMTGIEVEANLLNRVAVKSEGWVTGLRLLLLALKHRGQLERLLKDIPEDSQWGREYLFEEVLVRQAPEVRQMLMFTALFDRFSAPLCEALVAGTNGAATAAINGWDFISMVRKKNLFIVPLDIDNQWFRYHHLFQKLLINQLRRHFPPEAIVALHQKASAWFADSGLIEEALQQALAADDISAATRLLAKHGYEMMNAEQWSRLGRWLNRFSPDLVEQKPELLILKAWHSHVLNAGHDLPALGTFIEKLEKQIEDLPDNASTRNKVLNGHLDALRGFQSVIYANGEKALEYTRSAYEKIPAHHKRARALANIFQFGAYQMTGDLETGRAIYGQEIEKCIAADREYYPIYLANYCFIYWMAADLVRMRQTAEHSLEMAMRHRRPEATAFSLFFLGIVCYQQNDLQVAEEKLTILLRDFYFINLGFHVHGSVALSMIHMARGEYHRCRKVIENLIKDAIDADYQFIQSILRAFQAEQALHQGKLAEASQWAKDFNPQPLLLPFLFYLPHLTFTKILIAQNTTASRKQAADLLDQLHSFLLKIHNRRFQIDVLALQAILSDRMGQMRVAHSKIEQALEMAEPGRFIRPFVDLGQPMAALLERFNMATPPNDYRRSVISAFGKGESKPVLTDVLMSNRELDILSLLSQRLRNKEIAEQLFISPETVKKHLYNIYKKLGVNKRRQAVAKAEGMGIIARR